MMFVESSKNCIQILNQLHFLWTKQSNTQLQGHHCDSCQLMMLKPHVSKEKSRLFRFNSVGQPNTGEGATALRDGTARNYQRRERLTQEKLRKELMVRHQIEKLRMKQTIYYLRDLCNISKKRIGKRKIMFKAAFLEVMHGKRLVKKAFDAVLYNRFKTLAHKRQQAKRHRHQVFCKVLGKGKMSKILHSWRFQALKIARPSPSPGCDRHEQPSQVIQNFRTTAQGSGPDLMIQHITVGSMATICSPIRDPPTNFTVLSPAFHAWRYHTAQNDEQ
eukprot:753910-Hanusia_phi.AAC.1